MFTTAQFLQFRQHNANQFLPADKQAPTIMVTSHIWWTDFISLALHQMGYNVLIAAPLYLLFTDDAGWANIESLYDQFLAMMKQFNVSLILGGNSTAMAPHPKTGILLHEAAGVPVVHYWWDEPRTRPPYMKHGGTPAEYLGHLKNPRSLNVWWDVDVKEEMAAFYNVGGIHVPLGTLSDFWPSMFVPLEARRIALCFLGNCHSNAAHTENRAAPILAWANGVIDRKLANLDLPMTECILRGVIEAENSPFVTGAPVGEATPGDAWSAAFLDWELINLVYMHRTRNLIVQAAAERWKDYLLLIGKGWEAVGLKANREHSGLPAAGEFYGNARVSLNLFGGCVHGGMPLRPYEIAASQGLIVSHYNRELPGLYEAGKECLAFRNVEEMNAIIDRLIHFPAEYNALVAAGRKRTLAEHTWHERMKMVLRGAAEKFGWSGLPG